jgi:hypothetical protein
MCSIEPIPFKSIHTYTQIVHNKAMIFFPTSEFDTQQNFSTFDSFDSFDELL